MRLNASRAGHDKLVRSAQYACRSPLNDDSFYRENLFRSSKVIMVVKLLSDDSLSSWNVFFSFPNFSLQKELPSLCQISHRKKVDFCNFEISFSQTGGSVQTKLSSSGSPVGSNSLLRQKAAQTWNLYRLPSLLRCLRRPS